MLPHPSSPARQRLASHATIIAIQPVYVIAYLRA